jgi:hypothetical protein
MKEEKVAIKLYELDLVRIRTREKRQNGDVVDRLLSACGGRESVETREGLENGERTVMMHVGGEGYRPQGASVQLPIKF